MMDDERTLAELTDGRLDDVDATILAQVRRLYDDVDPVPVDLTERVHFALALDEVFDEVARMTRMPVDALAVRNEKATSTRTETLTFSADRLTAMVTVSRLGDDRLRLDGWLAPPEAYLVRLRLQNGPQLEVEADADGRFRFDDLADGFGQLSFHPLDDDAADNAVVTPLFQL